MTRLPIGSMTRTKLGYLNHAACKPQMYLSLEGNKYDPGQRATVYEIEIGVLSGNDVAVHRRFLRFSSLERLDQNIRPFLESSRHAIPFPPKRYFGNFSQDFVNERSSQLQRYLFELTKIPDISRQIAFVDCFDLELNIFKY
jgi:hypothetical protein